MVSIADDVRRGWRRNVSDVVWTILFVLRNACATVAIAWVMMFVVCFGNVFSGRSVSEQSALEFTCTILLWMKLFNWLCIAATYAATLLPQRFTVTPDVRPSFMLCLTKVLRGSARLFLAMGIVTLAVTIALFQGPDVIRASHIEFYVYATWCQLDTAACHVASARIFIEETVRGEAKRLAAGPRRPVVYWKQLARTFPATFSNMSAFFVTALYTHIMSLISLTTSAQLLIFTVCGFALKVALQELAKFCTFRQRVHTAVGVAARVSIPTVMVDTQTRVVLLLSPTASATLSGTLVMAVFEIVFRCGKSYNVAYRIKKERAKRAVAVADASYQSEHSERAGSTASVVPSSEAAPPSHREDFDKWRLRYLHYHAAEVYADMFAEYIALGCSYVILYFCWSHPKVMLSRFHRASNSDSLEAAAASNSLASVVGGSQAIIMGVQVGAEVVVDYLSCVLELRNGVDLQPLRRHSFFFVVLLLVAAIANLTISSCVFKLP